MRMLLRFFILTLAFAFAFIEIAAQNVDEKGVGASKNIVVGSTAAPIQAPKGRKAFLVSVAAYYRNNIPPLDGVANDVVAVRERLLKIGFNEKDIIMLRTGEVNYDNLPSYENICNRFEGFIRSLQKNDVAFVYLSGHGFQKNEGENSTAFFAAWDVELQRPFEKSVSINEMMERLDRSDASFRLMIVDACRDNPDGGAKSFWEKTQGNATPRTTSGVKGLQAVENAPEMIALLQSCSPGERSYEGPVDGGKKEGFFTHSLLEALDPSASKAEDVDGDGLLSLKEMFDYVQRRTSELARKENAKQEPVCSYDFSNGGDFALLELEKKIVPTPQPETTTATMKPETTAETPEEGASTNWPAETEKTEAEKVEAEKAEEEETESSLTNVWSLWAACGAILATAILLAVARSRTREAFDAEAWRASGLSKRAWKQARRHYAAAQEAADDDKLEDAALEIGAALAFDEKNADYQFLKSVVEARLEVKRFEEERLKKLAETRRAEEERVAREKEAAKREERRRELEKLANERAEAKEKARQAEEARLAEQARLARAAEEARLAREAEERRLAEEAERRAEAERKAEEERLAREAEERRLLEESERWAEAERQAKEERLAREAEERRLLEEAARRAEAARRIEAARLAREAEERRLAEEAELREEAARRIEAARLAREAEERRLAEEAERQAEAERKAEEERLAREAEERRLAEEAELREEATRKIEAARLAREAEERRLAEEAELREEAARKIEAARLAREAEERRLAEEAELREEAARKIEAARLAREAEERRLAEEAELREETTRKIEEARLAREAEERRLAEEAELREETTRKIEEARLAREAEERRLAEEAELREETTRKIEEARLAREAEERRLAEEAELREETARKIEEARLAREAEERRLAEAAKLREETARKLEEARCAREIEERRLEGEAKRRATLEERREEANRLARLVEGATRLSESFARASERQAAKNVAPNNDWRGVGEVSGARQILMFKDVELPFRWCPAGTFWMGSPANEPGRDGLETFRKTTLTQGFWLLETPTTQEMWRAALDENPSAFRPGGPRGARVRENEADKTPVESVSWNDCVRYVAAMNASGVAPEGWRFALPTEAQWEYACRAGSRGATNVRGASLEETGYFRANSGGRPRVVGGKKANAWGFVDMLGNVWEFCSDCFAAIAPELAIDPMGPAGGRRSARAARGGGWRSVAKDCRPASRTGVDPTIRTEFNGMRLAMVRVVELAQGAPPAAPK